MVALGDDFSNCNGSAILFLTILHGLAVLNPFQVRWVACFWCWTGFLCYIIHAYILKPNFILQPGVETVVNFKFPLSPLTPSLPVRHYVLQFKEPTNSQSCCTSYRQYIGVGIARGPMSNPLLPADRQRPTFTFFSHQWSVRSSKSVTIYSDDPLSPWDLWDHRDALATVRLFLPAGIHFPLEISAVRRGRTPCSTAWSHELRRPRNCGGPTAYQTQDTRT